MVISTASSDVESEADASVTPWEDFEQIPTSPTPWEEYDVIPVWDLIEESEDGKQVHYNVRVD